MPKRDRKGTGTLNLRWTVELAAAFAWQGATGFRHEPEESADQLWNVREHARRLASHWQNSLRASGDITPTRSSSLLDRPAGQPSEDLLAEILVTAMPIRLWAAAVCAADRNSPIPAAIPLCRSVVDLHTQMFTRALQILATPGAIDDDSFFPLNRLRRQTERWTDLLIGRYVVEYDLDHLAFDVDQARDFGQRHLDQARQNPQRRVRSLAHAGLRLAFGDQCRFRLPSMELLSMIAHSLLVTWSEEAFTPGQALRRFRQLRTWPHADIPTSGDTRRPAPPTEKTVPAHTTPALRLFPHQSPGLRFAELRPAASLRPMKRFPSRETPAPLECRLAPRG